MEHSERLQGETDEIGRAGFGGRGAARVGCNSHDGDVIGSSSHRDDDSEGTRRRRDIASRERLIMSLGKGFDAG